jgi:O-acetyl-ADP-ribose deacetylase (regulator of RNase III)
VNLPQKIMLVDRSGPLAAAWREVFRDHPEIEVVVGDFFEREADAMISPANSFGIMDGGLDAAIHAAIPGIERAVQDIIRSKHHGEMPIGVAELVVTNDRRWPWLVCAPTMRIPDDVSRTVNAYLAFRAALLCIRTHNEEHPSKPIRSVLCPGLCTGIGAMPPRRCAAQMRVAYRQVLAEPDVPDFDTIHKTHRAMRTAD